MVNKNIDCATLNRLNDVCQYFSLGLKLFFENIEKKV